MAFFTHQAHLERHGITAFVAEGKVTERTVHNTLCVRQVGQGPVKFQLFAGNVVIVEGIAQTIAEAKALVIQDAIKREVL